MFSYRWHPYAVDPAVDYTKEQPTSVTFTLKDAPGDGTLLMVVESGFDNVPPHRRLEAFRMNNRGWEGQLGDPTRLKLVAALCVGGAFSIAQLTANTDISRQGVTKHLQVLADAGVVRDVKLGRERLWQLEPGQIEEARRTLEVIGREWEVALGKLKAFVESS